MVISLIYPTFQMLSENDAVYCTTSYTLWYTVLHSGTLYYTLIHCTTSYQTVVHCTRL